MLEVRGTLEEKQIIRSDTSYLVAEQLIDDTNDLLGEERSADIVVRVGRLAIGQTAAVHFWVHDLYLRAQLSKGQQYTWVSE